MERLESLIQKLSHQYKNNVPVTDLLATAQMIMQELSARHKETAVLGASRVSVFVPNAGFANISNEQAASKKEYYQLHINEEDISNEEILEQQQFNKDLLYANTVRLANFDPLYEVPTLSIQDNKLKRRKKIAKAEPEIPKSISEQEKEKFIKELFRSDKDMFERSLTTILRFNTYPEAEFWIKRELKTKLGWLYDSPLVSQFDAFVKQKFA